MAGDKLMEALLLAYGLPGAMVLGTAWWGRMEKARADKEREYSQEALKSVLEMGHRHELAIRELTAAIRGGK